MSGFTSRGYLIRKCTYPTSLIFSSLTQVQKGFPKLTWIKHQTSSSEHCRCPFCFDILMKEHSVIAFLYLGWLILSYLSDSLLGLSPLNYFGITLEFAGPVFPRSTLLKTTDIQFIKHSTALVNIAAVHCALISEHTINLEKGSQIWWNSLSPA